MGEPARARVELPSYPLVCSAHSVRQILAGKKTQTRRIVNMRDVGFIAGRDDDEADPANWGYEDGHGEWGVLERGRSGRGQLGDVYSIRAPHAPHGDGAAHLWVRETWSPDHRDVYPCPPYVYRADPCAPQPHEYKEHCSLCVPPEHGDGECLKCAGFRWRSPRFMPRRASRLALLLTKVRVERLQRITVDDIVAEGIEVPDVDYSVPDHPYALDMEREAWAREHWCKGWDAINGKRASWSTDPFVWVYDFEVIR